jgi:hypothetical protein
VKEFKDLLLKCDPWSTCLKPAKDFNKVNGWKWKILTYGLKISILDYGGYSKKNYTSRDSEEEGHFTNFDVDDSKMSSLSDFIQQGAFNIGHLLLKKARVLQKLKKPEESRWKSDTGLDFLNMKFLGWEGILVKTELNKSRFLGGDPSVIEFLEDGDKLATYFGSKKLFYHSDMFIDEINICLGLNWTFGLRSIKNWFKTLNPNKKKPVARPSSSNTFVRPGEETFGM